jgi:hypothetical protein
LLDVAKDACEYCANARLPSDFYEIKPYPEAGS